MAKETINIGSAPNDGTGDTVRESFNKCNANFTELYNGSLLSLTPTKGRVVVGNGTAWAVLSVGTDGQVITADSAQALGVKWATPSGGGSGGGSLAIVKAIKGGTDQTGLGNGSWTTISWPVEDSDTGGDFASDTLTVASGEEWEVKTIFKTLQATNANIVEVALFKDGSHYATLSGGASYGSGASYGGSYYITEAGDYTVRAYSPGGQSLSAEGDAISTWFQAIRFK